MSTIRSGDPPETVRPRGWPALDPTDVRYGPRREGTLLYVHRSNRLERLVDALSDVLDTSRDDPFVARKVVVPSRGMATWVSLELARRRGVAAHLELPTPRAYMQELLAAVEGVDPRTAWSRPRVAWALLELLPEHLAEPAFAPLRSWLGEHGLDRRWQLARRIAHVFDQYAVYRPAMVQAWSAGGEAEADDAWQPVLWRALEARLGRHHPAAWAEAFPERAATSDALPPRVLLFGLTTLPPLYLDLLAALPEAVPVHLFLLCPSNEWWADIRSRREQARVLKGHDPSAGDEARALHHLHEGHPLLARLGRVARDFQEVLEDRQYVPDDDALFAPPPGTSALSLVQRDIFEVRERGAGERVALAADDRSIRIHGCHSPAREVEVLRDQLVELLQADPTLRPRDIVVLTPDIGLHGPLIDAVFAVGPDHPLHIPYTVADRPVAEGNEVARALIALMDLVGTRLSAPDVVDLLSHATLRRRFQIEEPEVAELEALVAEAGIRWGRDEAHRAEVGQPGLDIYTWRFGLDRLLLGHAAMPTTPVHGRMPLEHVEGDAAERAGRLADLVEGVLSIVEALDAPRDPAGWRDHLAHLLDDLFGADEDAADEAQRVRDALDALADDASAAGWHDPVPLDIVRDLLERDLLAERRVGAFLRRGVTFCEMLPMRSIPARVVAVLGMSDGLFPRADSQLGFDLMAARPARGDRSKRDDDRQLLLEAVLSARDTLVITWVSHSVQDNKPLPPSVVLAELLDTLDATFEPVQGEPASRALLVHHPLQPFSTRYVDGADPRLRTWDAAAAEGARALAGGQAPAPPFYEEPLPPDEVVDEVALSDLLRWARDPVTWYLQQRLGVGAPTEDTELLEREPVDLEGLDDWQVGHRLLELRQDGLDWKACAEILRSEARLPLGHLANPILARAARRVDGILAAASGRLAEPVAPPVPVELLLDGVRLMGRIDHVRASARVELSYSSGGRGAARRWFEQWILHLAMVASSSRAPEVSEWYARDGDRGRCCARYADVPAAEARSLLSQLVAVFVQGHAQPVPFHPAAAWAFLDDVRSGREPEQGLRKARKELERSWEFDAFAASAWSRLVGGPDALQLERDALAFPVLAERLVGPARDRLGGR